MYSPEQDFHLEPNQHFPMASVSTPYTTVGAVPVTRNPPRIPPSNGYMHQRQGNYGGAMAISPSNPVSRHSMSFADPHPNWLGTSLDSASSSFGHSPIFTGRNLILSPSTSSGHLEGFHGHEDDDHQQRNLQNMFEKRRRRRESHNAVERKRRDNINEQLCSLLPERLLDTAPTASNVMSVNTQQGVHTRAINKGTILKLSVEHIKELREEVSQCQRRMLQLEQMIQVAKRDELTEIKALTKDSLPKYANEDNNYTQSIVPTVQHERMDSFQFHH
ncbi:hypothetical protein BDF14DRAFT_1727475 [Spinellus fusiger]|nr:hypothetical protein BDF14DRAFT_1727475 [Spinellus fusiger]